MKTLSEHERFGQLLKRYRTEQGLSLRDLAALSGLHFSTIGHLENGRRIVPSGKTVKALIDGLRLDSQEAEELIWKTLFTVVQAYQEKAIKEG